MSEVSCAASVVSHDVAIPKEFVLVGCEAIQPHGASCMKFACADTQFGPKPITETIRESRWGIMVAACRIDLFHETAGDVTVFCDYGLGVTGVIAMNMTNGLR